MTVDELLEAYYEDEELEYNITGGEQGGDFLKPGWYSCIINYVENNGDVGISFTDPGFKHVDVTVLKKNLAIAFRRKP